MVAKKLSAATVARRSAPKTTRPEAATRRAPELGRSAAQRIGKKLDAFPDRIDTGFTARACSRCPIRSSTAIRCPEFSIRAAKARAPALRSRLASILRLRHAVSGDASALARESEARRPPGNVEWRRDLTHAHARMALVLISLKDTFAGELHRTRAREVSFGN